MTRFARASGSKGANERRPEDATSWKDLKAGIKANNNSVTENTVNNESAMVSIPTAGEVKSVWVSLVSEFKNNGSVLPGIKKRKRSCLDSDKPHITEECSDVPKKNERNMDDYKERSVLPEIKKKKKNSKVVMESSGVPTKKKKNKRLDKLDSSTKCEVEILSTDNPKDNFNKLNSKQIKKMNKEKTESNSATKCVPEISKKKKKSSACSVEETARNHRPITSDLKMKKEKKRKACESVDVQDHIRSIKTSASSNDRKKKKKHLEEENKEMLFKGNPNSKKSNITLKKAKKQMLCNTNTTINKEIQFTSKSSDSKPLNTSKKKKTVNVPYSDDNCKIELQNSSNNVLTPKVKKRKRDMLSEIEIILNGKPVKVAPFDGFMVLAEDSNRLKELRQNMIQKGIDKTEREKAIKLERRRAEKALSRLKKQVCFHCRGSGHVLSECPMIEQDQSATGICYKCGSTEHTHYQCRVSRKDDFRFAECFICKEQGHIAKQCPDNPRGLYPKGGACAECGDVTHMKKDCPKYVSKQQEYTFSISTRNDRKLEALDEDFQDQSSSFTPIPKRKHIKFD